jgi:hypothetical protein
MKVLKRENLLREICVGIRELVAKTTPFYNRAALYQRLLRLVR